MINGGQQNSWDGTSPMNREVDVWICQRLGAEIFLGRLA
jgi:hypothetical protein